MARPDLRIIVIPLIASLFITACTLGEHHKIHFDKEDETEIRAMISEYRDGWLRGDSATILNLFSDSATLIPNGLRPIIGKKEIIRFWWPNDSSKTTINSYQIDILEVRGAEDLAYTFENGKLEWSYSKGDFGMSKKQESFEITIFQKNESGRWNITKRIWTDMKN